MFYHWKYNHSFYKEKLWSTLKIATVSLKILIEIARVKTCKHNERGHWTYYTHILNPVSTKSQKTNKQINQQLILIETFTKDGRNTDRKDQLGNNILVYISDRALEEHSFDCSSSQTVNGGGCRQAACSACWTQHWSRKVNSPYLVCTVCMMSHRSFGSLLAR